MIYIIINIVLTIISLVLWTKYKLRYYKPLFFICVSISLISIWTYFGGDIYGITNISSKLLLVIFSGISWIKSKDSFWYRLTPITLMFLFLTVYNIYVEKNLFQSATLALIVSKTIVSIIYSLLLSLLAWLMLPMVGINKKATIIITLLIFIVLAFFDIIQIWNLIM